MENYQATMAEKADEHAILNSCEGGRRRRPLSLRRFFELRGLRWLREGHSEMVEMIICTMQDSDRANEPHPRSDLCSLRKHGAAYNLYWPGKTKEDCHLSRVGYMLKNVLHSELPCLSSLLLGNLDCLISLFLTFQGN